jgi:hypothetical protein
MLAYPRTADGGEGPLAALRRSSSRVADAVRGPASQLASSVTMETAGASAQKAGGGVAAVGSVASTAAKVNLNKAMRYVFLPHIYYIYHSVLKRQVRYNSGGVGRGCIDSCLGGSGDRGGNCHC